MSPSHRPPPPQVVGRYALYGEIASGGMATVYFGRLMGPVGFSRTVAIKRLQPHFARDPEFVAMFLDEARLAARVHHPNVAATLDVVASEGELFLVMEYVQGESLARLLQATTQRGELVPVRIAASIAAGALLGLHAAHEACDEHGTHLKLVHRDISPQNIVLGADGVPRVLDFGIAKAIGRAQTTREGHVKGKLAYMAPEQFSGEPVGRPADVYASAVVLWEALTAKRLFAGDNEAVVLARLMHHEVSPPSEHRPEIPPEIDAIVLKGLARKPSERFATAREMAFALEAAVGAVSSTEVSAWVERIAGKELAARAQLIARMERSSLELSGAGDDSPISVSPPPPSEARAAAGRDATLGASAEPATTPDGRRGMMFAPTVPDREPEQETQAVASTSTTAVFLQRLKARALRARLTLVVLALAGLGVVGVAVAKSLPSRRPPTPAVVQPRPEPRTEPLPLAIPPPPAAVATSSNGPGMPPPSSSLPSAPAPSVAKKGRGGSGGSKPTSADVAIGGRQ